MNRLRKEIRNLLADTETERMPALRRSLREDFLYATDLPQAADEAAAAGFCSRAREAGWRTEEADGWIQLVKPGASPRDTGFAGPYGTEAACCASLLRRHTGGRRNGEKEMRLLAKAGEESAEAFEKVCRLLHREWAAALRTRESLPEIPAELFEEERER